LSLTRIVTSAGISDAEVLGLAAGLERHSAHPIAAALRAAAAAAGVEPVGVTEARTVVGRGVQGASGGRAVAIGSPRFASEASQIDDLLSGAVASIAATGETAIVVARDAIAIAVLGIGDRLKPSAVEGIAALRAMGLRTVLLTGDEEAAARQVAGQVGIDDVRASVLPEQKAEIIAELQANGSRVAMVGDGINDSAALATAQLGLAVVDGTDLAIRSADIILVRDDLRVIAQSLSLARATLRTIRGNLVWAFAYNMAAVPLAAAGLLNPLIAAGAMSLSSVLVVANSLRLQRRRL